jgi:hypothetical protein
MAPSYEFSLRALFGKVHRNLSAQARGGLIPGNASAPEMIGDGGFDLL